MIVMSSLVLNGFSGSCASTAEVDKVIAALNKYSSHGLNCYRISSNPVWTSGTRPWGDGVYAQWFLDHTPSNYYLIINRNHHFSESMGSAEWVQAEVSILDLLSRTDRSFGNNPRVKVEILNEYTGSDLFTKCQNIINHIRNGVTLNGKTYPPFTNVILQDNQWQANQSSTWTKLQDPLTPVLQGQHFYMDQTNVDAKGYMNKAIASGITSLCNTEVGANATEPGGSTPFSTANINALKSFMQFCNREGTSPPSVKIGTLIWLNHHTENLDNYENSGYATWLPYYDPTPPPPQYTLRLSSNPTGVLWTINGVPNKPAGDYPFNQGSNVTLVVPNQVSS